MSNFFFLINLKCPECGKFGDYYDMPNIVCDLCVADIRINGEYQK